MKGKIVLESQRATGHEVTLFDAGPSRHGLMIAPTSCGYERRTGPGYDWDGRRRGAMPFTILQLTLSGRGNLMADGERREALPGEAMALTVPGDHRYWLEDGEEWEFLWVSMTGPEALRLHALAREAAGPVIRFSPEAAEQLGESLFALIRTRGADPFALSALAYRIGMILLNTALSQRGAQRPTPEAVERVLAYIAAHPGAPLDVARMARIAGLSRAHFSRQFAAVTGQSPAEYALRESLLFAARLIGAEPDLSLKLVAARAGFSDPNYFSKAFRRALGVSPSEFRSSGMFHDPARPWAMR